jgi:peptide deformylase
MMGNIPSALRVFLQNQSYEKLIPAFATPVDGVHLQPTHNRMAIRDILLLGNPQLYKRSKPVRKSELSAALKIGEDLREIMMNFRRRHGWGHTIAAPQIGVLKRIVYLELDKPWLIINPAMEAASAEMIELWDDCMSFPDLLVRVRRHASLH